jgi:cell division protein FtsZ
MTISFADMPEVRPPIEGDDVVVLKVVGVGGGGGNAVNTMVDAGLKGAEFIATNTDQQALRELKVTQKVQLGYGLTNGLGAGARPEVGRQAAEESAEEMKELLRGSNMVFVTAGMGGGTGTGAAPIIARAAKEVGALTVGVVTKPFNFEGKKRRRHADQGIRELREVVDTLIVIPNQRLLSIAGEQTSMKDAFRKADEVLLHAVKGIVELIQVKGIINVDFADVRTVMSNQGLALMGIGSANGKMKAVEAAQRAISSPLLDEISITGATGILINITGNSDLKLYEVNEAATLIQEEAHEDAEIIFGWVIDDDMEDEVQVTVIATGFEAEEQVVNPSAPPLSGVFRPVPPRTQAVTPWAGAKDPLDVPTAVRERRISQEYDRPPQEDTRLLERDRQMVLEKQVPLDMDELDRPAYMRKIAD